ncbi:MAG: hypothetical protein ACI8ZZ_002025, partial [Gammaproteobacteria bacterium]
GGRHRVVTLAPELHQALRSQIVLVEQYLLLICIQNCTTLPHEGTYTGKTSKDDKG